MIVRPLLAALLLGAAACAPSPPPPAPPPPAPAPPPTPAPPPSAEPAAPPSADEGDEAIRRVRAMLVRVARARKLPVRGEVPARALDRDRLLAQIRAHVAAEVPRETVESEGEVMVALELVPPEYDFYEGTLALLGGRIAGYYEPSDHTMYLASDLDEGEATETLAHELVHALQDQSFALAKLIAYVPGGGDRTAAVHTVVEGDAMSAELDVVAGSAFNVSEEALRLLLARSNAASPVSAKAPHILQASLIAPYADGFAFVQRHRAAGGWDAVDAALRTPPASTEQILHDDKLASREPPVPVPTPTFAALGPGFRAADDDVIGEQGLRLILEEWTSGAEAAQAAAGWGGDHYVVARRDATVALGWHAVMDTDADAAELAAVLAKKLGKKCRERPRLGPIAWRRHGRDLVLAAGPFTHHDREAASAGSCAGTTKWIDELLRPAHP